MRIVFCGIIGRYPWGGVTWCSLMYLIGLRDLGHEVWYLEDTCECNFDPDANTIATEPDYALRTIAESLGPFGFGDRWCYVDYRGIHHGLSEQRMKEVCGSADLFLVLSGGCWVWRDHYLGIPRKAFIDSDPAFTQLALQAAIEKSASDSGKKWYAEFFQAYDVLFTFGSNIGNDDCAIPDCGMTWHKTWQPVVADLWKPPHALPPREAWTTVMTWQIESFEDIGGNKDSEFRKVIHLANRPDSPPIELAVSGPLSLLREHGWRCVPAFDISRDIWRYHAWITSSRGEFSVAKKTYVETRSGWFSDRTECYLMAGRPAVIQETGFSKVIETGEGLFAWNTGEEALEGMAAVRGDYPRHARAAAELALAHFRAETVLGRLLDQCG